MCKVKKIKVLRAKTSHPNKQTFLISDLTYIKKNPYPNTLPEDQRNTWLDAGMNDPIEVIQHSISPTERRGANGAIYIEKKYSVRKGSSRITAALEKGYDAIEGIIVND